MVVRGVVLAAVVALLAPGCSGAPDDLDRLPEVGTTAGWPVDLVVALTPDEDAFAAPCRRL